MLAGKKIILGVTGSIAAYKAALILRRLMAEGAEVTVVMTEAARKFVGPVTFEGLSRRPVYHDLFDSRDEIIHLSLAQDADLILIAPATADFLARTAHGFAQDLLSAVVMAARCEVLMAPAMDAVMWENPAVQANIGRLAEMGVKIIDPEEGPLASGIVGAGRLASEEKITAEAIRSLSVARDLAGETVLVTAGPTVEPLDPVRFISNRSSGKMGYAVAGAAKARGARVILVSGPTALIPPRGVEFLGVETAEEMRLAVTKFFPEASVLVMVAAVSDYHPASPVAQKVPKQREKLVLELIPTRDILEEVDGLRRDQIVVGFSAETQDVVENAREKLKKKKLDLIVANNVQLPGAGFGTDTNIVSLIDLEGGVEDLPKMTKDRIAEKILDRVLQIKRRRGPSARPRPRK